MDPKCDQQKPVPKSTFVNTSDSLQFTTNSLQKPQSPLLEYHNMFTSTQNYLVRKIEGIENQQFCLKLEGKVESEIVPKTEVKMELKEEADSKAETSPSPKVGVLPPLLNSNPYGILQEMNNQALREPPESSYIRLSLREQINFNAYLLKELDKIVRFIVCNMGKDNKTAMDTMKNQYLGNQSLFQIFEKLEMKYYSAKKCKEDIIRYILRKAFKVMKTNIGTEAKVCGKKASLLLCTKYFHSKFSEIEDEGIDIENGDEILEFLMPYKKNSKNKTMNTSFVMEVFSSEEFCREYENFLKSFDGIIQEDNDKKIEKLVSFLAECVKKDSISKIASFSRLPWLEIWIEDTKKIAVSLLPSKDLNNKSKKLKDKKS